MACSRRSIAAVVCAGVLSCTLLHRAGQCGESDPVPAPKNEAALKAEAEAIEKEIELLKKDLEKSKDAKATASKVDKALQKKKADLNVRSADGKLKIGGLVQTWYVQYQRDSRGLFDMPSRGVYDTNDGGDNSTFQVRRAQLSFTLKANGYATAYMMIDPAAEANSYPLSTYNQSFGNSIFKSSNQVPPERAGNQNGVLLGNFQTITNLQYGFGVPNRLLQDAYINFHNDMTMPGDFDWHHDFQVGQFIPAFGEEGLRSSAQLDFVERSFVGLLGHDRDLGAQLHGSWINDRFQYWVGVFNGAQDFHQSNGQGNARSGANRSDNNDAKDVAIRMLIRPICNPCYGDLEIGYSNQFGYHGETGVADPILFPINALERRRNFAMRQDAWAYYAPGGCLSGFWARGEWGWFKDRNSPGTVMDFTANGNTSYLNVGAPGSAAFAQSNGRAFSVQGWYAAGGYRFSQSGLFDKGGDLEKCKMLSKVLKPMELAFRYQSFQNVLTSDLVESTKTDVFSTRVYTGGINYYIADQNAKLQLNYNAIINPDTVNPERTFHNVRNNSLVFNFQVAF